MSEHKNDIYSKAVLFSIVAAVVVLIGTIATVFIPMFTKGMNPKLDNLKPYTALQLAGRDIYQKEGCFNCHTQTVRPLKADVLRYGDYSKAGEFAYDQPFLWGSKRTGPDLARVGEKYPDEWHYQHFTKPQAFYPKSNMPPYPWLNDRKLNPGSIQAHMSALGFPYTDEEINALAEKTEMDALVAYIQVLGTAVEKTPLIELDEDAVPAVNPLKGDPKALLEGKRLYNMECAGCHGWKAEGNIGASLVEYAEAEPEDADTYIIVAGGVEGAMPAFINTFSTNQLWAVAAYLHSLAPRAQPAPVEQPQQAEPEAAPEETKVPAAEKKEE